MTDFRRTEGGGPEGRKENTRRWRRRVGNHRARSKTTEILESAQYDSTIGRETKRNNVCVARNVADIPLPPSFLVPPHLVQSERFLTRPRSANQGFVNIERVLASTVPKWPTFSRPLVRV